MTLIEKIWVLVDEWLTKADEDYQAAEYMIAGKRDFAAIIGFHAQQACEKYLKALLTAHQIEFSKTHDLNLLIYLLEPVIPGLSSQFGDLSWLTKLGVDHRYPGAYPVLTAVGSQRAVKAMNLVRSGTLALLELRKPEKTNHRTLGEV
jgi:HEPN domain-containing protein